MATEGESDHAVPIVKVHETGKTKLRLDTNALMGVLNKAKDIPVSVLAIAGEYRTGKSFLLNFLIQYLRACEEEGPNDWLKDEGPLHGFKWAPGAERTTIGILLWSRPFIITQNDGSKVAVLLMDTQGLFDQETAPEDAATIFALSTLISTTQIYNVMRNIGEHHLKHLELFVETAKMVLEENTGRMKEAPFQHLVYLVRDWSDPRRYSFGRDGGEGYLREKLEVHSDQPEDLQEVRKNIHTCFNSFKCFLMPHPGSKATESPDPDEGESRAFDGQLKDLPKRFVKRIRDLALFLLDPSRIPVKTLGSNPMTGAELADSIVRYMTLFQSGKLPPPSTTREALVSEYNTALVMSEKEQIKVALKYHGKPFPLEVLRNGNEYMETLLKARCGILDRFPTKARGNGDEVERFTKKLDASVTEIIDLTWLELQKAILTKKQEDEGTGRESISKACESYNTNMERRLATETVTAQELKGLHEACKRDIMKRFLLEIQHLLLDQNVLFDDLISNIEQIFNTFKSRNTEKILEKELDKAKWSSLAQEALTDYKRNMATVCSPGGRYAEPYVLEQYHVQSQSKAFEMYDGSTIKDLGFKKLMRSELLQKMKTAYSNYLMTNEDNRRIKLEKERQCKGIAEKAKQEYLASMRRDMSNGPFIERDLRVMHLRTFQSTMSDFKRMTCDLLEYRDKIIVNLEKDIAEDFTELQIWNNLAMKKKEQQRARDEALKAKIIRDFKEIYDEKFFAPFSGTKDDLGWMKNQNTDYHTLPSDMQKELQSYLEQMRIKYLKHEEEKRKTYEAQAQHCMVDGTRRAMNEYKYRMTKKCAIGQPFMTTMELDTLHAQSLKSASDKFRQITEEYPTKRQNFLVELKKQAQNEYPRYQELNELNNPKELPDSRTVNRTIENERVQSDNIFMKGLKTVVKAVETVAKVVAAPFVAIGKGILSLFGL